jgi:hypothetical protein
VPLDDDGLKGKFHGLVAPVLGDVCAKELAQRLWDVANATDVSSIVEMAAKPA